MTQSDRPCSRLSPHPECRRKNRYGYGEWTCFASPVREPPLDHQTADLLDALAERNIYSRGDLDQLSDRGPEPPLDVELLEAAREVDRDAGADEYLLECEKRLRAALVALSGPPSGGTDE